MTRGILILGTAILMAGAAQAATQSASLTCAQAEHLVSEKGAVVLATSPTLYDRYVRDQSFCYYDQQLKPEWVPTRDKAQCFVGYVCYDPARGGGRSGG